MGWVGEGSFVIILRQESGVNCPPSESISTLFTHAPPAVPTRMSFMWLSATQDSITNGKSWESARVPREPTSAGTYFPEEQHRESRRTFATLASAAGRRIEQVKLGPGRGPASKRPRHQARSVSQVVVHAFYMTRSNEIKDNATTSI